MTARGIAGVLLLVLVAAPACVKAPPRKAPDLGTIPDRWTAVPDVPPGEPDAAWWMAFGDARLNELIETALERNNDVRAAAARVERALAEARVAGADLRPSIAAGAGGSRQRQNFIGFPIPSPTGASGTGGVISSTTTRYDASLSVSWEADLWGRLRASGRAALADAEATAADLGAARLSIAANTAKAWFAVVEETLQVALAEETVESFRSLAEQVRGRYLIGVRPALDLRLALSNLAEAEVLLAGRRQRQDDAVRRVEVLLARYPDASLLAGVSPGDLQPPPPPVPVGVPADVIARRPDLVAAERRLAAADQRLLAARRSLYPRLSLTAGGGTASEALGDLLDGDFRVWSLVANLAQPLFQGGRLRANVDAADARVAEAVAVWAGDALQAFSEVEAALAAGRFLEEREVHQAEAVEQLAAATRLAEDRYRRGVAGYLAVLESQTRTLAARNALITLRRLRLDNRVDLHLALGGGFRGARVTDSRAAGNAEVEDE